MLTVFCPVCEKFQGLEMPLEERKCKLSYILTSRDDIIPRLIKLYLLRELGTDLPKSFDLGLHLFYCVDYKPTMSQVKSSVGSKKLGGLSLTAEEEETLKRLLK